MWAFEAYAEGLSVTTPDAEPITLKEPPRQLRKTSRNNDLFDASGKPLTASAMHDATTWRTHHAFGGRCALVKAAGEKDYCKDSFNNAAPFFPAHPSGPSWAEQAWSAYQTWSVAFRLRSVTTEEPHILLSVAPAYSPLLSSPTGEMREPDAATLASLPAAPTAEEQQHYNSRLLDTPLIWEEAYALSVECTPRGMFLWSDHWKLFGKKIADRCMEVANKTNEEEEGPATGHLSLQTYSGVVRLRFSPANALQSSKAAADPQVSVLGVDLRAPASVPQPLAVAASKEEDETLWQHVTDIPLPMDTLAQKIAFRPYVTLLESGDSVEII